MYLGLTKIINMRFFITEYKWFFFSFLLIPETCQIGIAKKTEQRHKKSHQQQLRLNSDNITSFWFISDDHQNLSGTKQTAARKLWYELEQKLKTIVYL